MDRDLHVASGSCCRSRAGFAFDGAVFTSGDRKFNPQYEIASYTLGKSRLATFLLITLPLARRGILAGIVLSFTRALGEFGATFMLAGNIAGKTQTMPLAIYEAVISGDNKRAQALALILTGVSVAAVYLTSKLTKGALRY